MSATWSLPLPILLFEERGKGETELDLDLDQDTHERKLLVCAECSAPITSDEDRIEKRGSHQHRFFNPYGIVYGIGCFGEAPGCRDEGDSSSQFSWFPNYLWRVTCCGRCGVHLGWHFFAADAAGFHGLILERLAAGGGE